MPGGPASYPATRIIPTRCRPSVPHAAWGQIRACCELPPHAVVRQRNSAPTRIHLCSSHASLHEGHLHVDSGGTSSRSPHFVNRRVAGEQPIPHACTLPANMATG
jgi:hypothetical protein